jgi:lysophospholipase
LVVVSAALTKLSCLLANADLSVQEIRKEMSRSIRGELTEQSEIHFAHPNSFLPPKVSSLTALGYAVANGSHEEITAIIKETKEFLLNEFDYSGNTPLVSDIFDFLVSSFPFASSRGCCSRLCLSSNEGIGRKGNT